MLNRRSQLLCILEWKPYFVVCKDKCRKNGSFTATFSCGFARQNNSFAIEEKLSQSSQRTCRAQNSAPCDKLTSITALNCASPARLLRPRRRSTARGSCRTTRRGSSSSISSGERRSPPTSSTASRSTCTSSPWCTRRSSGSTGHCRRRPGSQKKHLSREPAAGPCRGVARGHPCPTAPSALRRGSCLHPVRHRSSRKKTAELWMNLLSLGR